jgi:hypothetical protein
MNSDDALNLIVNKYIETFNEKPDSNMQMLIKLNVSRVASGENFKWENDNGWRVIKYIKD